MPILWFEQHVKADQDIANIVKLILAAPAAGQIIGVILVIIGLLLVVTTCLCTKGGYKVPSTDKSKTEIQITNLPESLPLMKN